MLDIEVCTYSHFQLVQMFLRSLGVISYGRLVLGESHKKLIQELGEGNLIFCCTDPTHLTFLANNNNNNNNVFTNSN